MMRDSLISFEDIEEKSNYNKCHECLNCIMPVCFHTLVISCLVGFTLYSYFSINEDGSSSY